MHSPPKSNPTTHHHDPHLSSSHGPTIVCSKKARSLNMGFTPKVSLGYDTFQIDQNYGESLLFFSFFISILPTILPTIVCAKKARSLYREFTPKIFSFFFFFFDRQKASFINKSQKGKSEFYRRKQGKVAGLYKKRGLSKNKPPHNQPSSKKLTYTHSLEM